MPYGTTVFSLPEVEAVRELHGPDRQDSETEAVPKPILRNALPILDSDQSEAAAIARFWHSSSKVVAQIHSSNRVIHAPGSSIER